MTKIFEKPIIFIPILILVGVYFFFSHLGGFALTDPDETFYAQTSKEMLERGEWVTPYLYGKPQFEKPILFYWLTHASYLMFGVNEFSARFPSALFALIGIVFMYLLGSKLFNRRVGALASLILATNIEYVMLARACVTDMVLTVFMLIGVYRFFCGYFDGKWYGYILSAIAFGFAVLTKGPVFIALALGVIGIFLIFSRDLGSIRRMPVLWGVLAYLAVTVPWYLFVYKLHGAAFVDEFFGFHNVTRFVVSEHKIGSQVYYNIPIIMGGFFPWSVFLPFGIWHAWKKARQQDPAARREKQAATFVLAWLAVIFFFFTASSTKLPTYIFPCFIALALIVAVLWDDLLQGNAPAVRKGFAISFYALIALAFIGTAGGVIYAALDYPSITAGVAVTCGAMLIGMVLALIAYRSQRPVVAFLAIVYALGVVLYPLSRLVLPEIERFETSKPIAMELNRLMKPTDLLGSESNYLAGLAFYTGKFPVNLDKHADLWKFLHEPGRIWAVIKEKNHRFLYEMSGQPTLDLTTYVLYKVGKRSIVTNRPPDDGKFLLKREPL